MDAMYDIIPTLMTFALIGLMVSFELLFVLELEEIMVDVDDALVAVEDIP